MLPHVLWSAVTFPSLCPEKNVCLLSSVPSSCPQPPAPVNVPVGPRECSPTTLLFLLLEHLVTSLILFGFFFSWIFFFLVCFWGQILKGADGARKGQINAEDSGLLCP